MTMRRRVVVGLACCGAFLSSGPRALAQLAWRDQSPHAAGFVAVNGVRLHYLDWGGAGDPVVFITGYGSSAHVYDDFAPRFTDRFRVVALTRRGHGESDMPPGGYDTGTLVEDLRKFMSALGIERAHLVGHSMAGAEMTKFAEAYPGSVASVTYLDAAYEGAAISAQLARQPIKAPPVDPTSLDTFRAGVKRRLGTWSAAHEASIRASHQLDSTGAFVGRMTKAIEDSVIGGHDATSLDFAKVRAPALSIFVRRTLASRYPWLVDPDAETLAKARAFLETVLRPYEDASIGKFRRELPNARLVVLEDTHHDLFLTRADTVAAIVRSFLLSASTR